MPDLNLGSELLQAALQASANAIVLTDAEGRIVWVNPAFTTMTGYAFDEVHGQSPRLLKSGVHSPEFYAQLWSTIVSGRTWQGEITNRRKNGSLYVEEATITPISDENGNVTHFVAVKQDVSDRRRAEEELRISEDRLKDAQALARLAYVRRDFDTGKVEWSEEGFRVFGVKSGEAAWTFEKLLSRLDPLDRTAFTTAIADTACPIFQQNLRVTLDDGAVLFLNCRGRTWLNAEGTVGGFAATFLNVTEQAVTQERLRMLFEHSLDAHLLFGRQGIVDCNPGALGMFGVTTKEPLLGLKMTDLSPPFQPSGRASHAMAREMVECARSTGVHRFDWVYRRFDGRELRVEVTAIPDLINGETAMLQVIHDLTERAKREEVLRLAKEAAEAGQRAKSEFLATMSHEIRTPMNGIIGMTSLLLDSALSSEQRDFVETIRASGDALLTVINDVLDFSKLEAGRIDLENIDFNLPMVVDDTIEVMAEPAEKKGIELQVLLEDEVPDWINGDPVRLRQILLNLLTNAVKFTERGRVLVHVKAAHNGNGVASLQWAVKDTGIGIAPASRERLFQSFTQADSSTTRRYGGTGLGLAIAKRLVEAMGGRIGVDSVEGEGSTFWFELDVAVAKPVAGDADVAAALAGKVVLAVDDNPDNLKVLRQHLHRLGMEFVEAGNGPDALAALAAGRRFDLAILDLHMPTMDGLTLARSIRARVSERELPILMLASYRDRELLADARQLGIASYLLKPVRHAPLSRAIRLSLGAEASSPAVPTGSFGLRPPSQGTWRVLLAEDNPVNQRVTALMLQRMGCHADVVGNGFEACDAMRQVSYDLVLMDCQMPDMDGYACTRAIRALEGSLRRTPIIALTANALKGEREQCLSAGMDDYLSKPITPDALSAALERWLPPVA
jgi:PAS domain S-box-containing protein